MRWGQMRDGNELEGLQADPTMGSQRLAKSLSKPRLTSNFILGSAPAKNPNKGRENKRADITAVLRLLQNQNAEVKQPLEAVGSQQSSWGPSSSLPNQHPRVLIYSAPGEEPPARRELLKSVPRLQPSPEKRQEEPPHPARGQDPW